MYWPIGAPSVYEQDIPTLKSDVTNDGLPRSPSQQPESLIPDLEKHSVADSNSLQNLEPATNGTGVGSHGSHLDHRLDRNGSANERPQRDYFKLKSNESDGSTILGVKSSRAGHIFATITREALTVWQTKPTVVLASVTRSASSLNAYGHNVSLLLRPDSALIVLQTSQGYLITYSLASHHSSEVYHLVFLDNERRHARRRSINASGRYAGKDKGGLLDGGVSVQGVSLRFRMVIKIDAGISQALALDEELVVVTKRPAAIQCIRWTPDRTSSQTATALLGRMPWFGKNVAPMEIVHDRPMNLFAWITDDGSVYAVQRSTNMGRESREARVTFDGHEFHRAENSTQVAVKAAINSRFSIIAVGCADGSIWLYSIRDYAGGITFLQKFLSPISTSTTGRITTLVYSPDGYCVFAGYEKGWMTWSVYGQLSASSFGQDHDRNANIGSEWLKGVSNTFWAGTGSELFLFGNRSSRFSILEFSRSALTGCFTSANVAHGLVQTSTGLKVYQGHGVPDVKTISTDVSLWHEVEVPTSYMDDQWPIRAAAVSPDGRYVAVAGQRGLAHYSVGSSRWKTFEDEEMQNEFSVRGGMCWHQHILIAAIEAESYHELRLYSRETALDNAKMLQNIPLSAPVVHLATSGDDSILVYTYENVLDHYVVVSNKKSIQLAKVGQIGLHGIIRAPARVRSVSWIVPEYQLQNGDPSQDVAVASVLFLVDGKLVLLQPTTSEEGALKYDMRVVAQNVEHYLLARDLVDLPTPGRRSEQKISASPDYPSIEGEGPGIRDSLWLFDGHYLRAWTDVQTLLESAPAEYGRDLPPSTSSPVDFYPLSVLLHKGILFGLESELSQGRDADLSYFRSVSRTSLFIPDVLRHLLSQYDSPGAMHLSHQYQNLSYFPHALEILLHKVLDEEVENKPSQAPQSSFSPPLPSWTPSSPIKLSNQNTPTIPPGFNSADNIPGSGPPLLHTTLSFLSTFPSYYLSTIIACTRKTELRSWRTLFSHLPSPQQLFDQALDQSDLKTAAGYLLVLHTFGDDDSESNDDTSLATPSTPDDSSRTRSRTMSSSQLYGWGVTQAGAAQSEQIVRLLRGVKEKRDWELGKELARFMMAVDGTGQSLRWALEMVGLGPGLRQEVDMQTGRGGDDLMQLEGG